MIESKASMQFQSKLFEVSTWLGLVWLDSRLGSAQVCLAEFQLGSSSFFVENESLGSASKARNHLHH